MIAPLAAATSSTALLAEPSTQNYIELLHSVPALAALPLGALVQSSKPVPLTELETEYVVNCVKHTFPAHFVFQFNVTNTLADQILSHVIVEMSIENADAPAAHSIHFVTVVPSGQIPCKASDACYVVFRRDAATGEEDPDADIAHLLLPCETFSCSMKFQVFEYDLDTKSVSEDFFEDEYELEGLELTAADFLRPLSLPDWNSAWEGVDEDHQAIETFNLSAAKSVVDAVNILTAAIGMQTCDNSGAAHVQPTALKHILFLSGAYLDGSPVIARIRMRKSAATGVDLELAVRSASFALSDAICRSIS
jgi:coatomer protein complex subunit gamma